MVNINRQYYKYILFIISITLKRLNGRKQHAYVPNMLAFTYQCTLYIFGGKCAAL